MLRWLQTGALSCPRWLAQRGASGSNAMCGAAGCRRSLPRLGLELRVVALAAGMHDRHSRELHCCGCFATFATARRCGRRGRGVGACRLLGCGILADCACLQLYWLCRCCIRGCRDDLRGCSLGCRARGFLDRSLRFLVVLLYPLRPMLGEQHASMGCLSQNGAETDSALGHRSWLGSVCQSSQRVQLLVRSPIAA